MLVVLALAAIALAQEDAEQPKSLTQAPVAEVAGADEEVSSSDTRNDPGAVGAPARDLLTLPEQQDLATPTPTPQPGATSTSAPASTLLPTATAQPSSAGQQLSGMAADAARLDRAAADVQDAVRAMDAARARQGWTTFEDLWLDLEDGFRATSRDAYRNIELAMGRVGETLRPASPDADLARREINALRALLQPFMASPAAPARPNEQTTAGAPTLAALRPTGSGMQAVALPIGPSPTLPATPTVGAPLDSCATPSLTIDPTNIRTDGFLDWVARGFKPGTVVRVAVYGPTFVGGISGPLVRSFEPQPVDRNCTARAEESLKGEELFEDNPGLPTGNYVLVVTGIRWTVPSKNIAEQDMRLHAPFNAYSVRRP
jgi:hypothetical protein